MYIVEWLIWVGIGMLIWTYAGYPVFIWFLAKLYPRHWKKKEFNGQVSLIIAAHNEQDVIREKVANSLRLDFGPCLSEIIVVSDGSIDNTEAILQEFKQRSDKLQVVTYQPRAGKANALNVGAKQAKGDILIFSDANVMIEVDACKALLQPFYDKHVGAVSGKVLVKARGKQEVAGESLYMKYEGWVQRSEALYNSMVGVDGALFALRRELFTSLDTNIILDDFSLSMNAPLAGFRIVYSEDAIAVEEVIPSVKNEFNRKTRIVSGGYQYLQDMLKNKTSLGPAMWFELLSHKILKWVAPFEMVLIFISNILLLNSVIYKLLFFSQVIFYLLAFSGHLFINLRKVHIMYIPYYFCVVNLAAFIGFFNYLKGGQKSLWVKVER